MTRFRHFAEGQYVTKPVSIVDARSIRRTITADSLDGALLRYLQDIVIVPIPMEAAEQLRKHIRDQRQPAIALVSNHAPGSILSWTVSPDREQFDWGNSARTGANELHFFRTCGLAPSGNFLLGRGGDSYMPFAWDGIPMIVLRTSDDTLFINASTNQRYIAVAPLGTRDEEIEKIRLKIKDLLVAADTDEKLNWVSDRINQMLRELNN